jgi:phosphopantothenoylcysteine synthetase/decarboxylase
MFYLAAAVSDFYLPWPDLPEHKIQSRDGELNLELQQVPKCLGLLRNEWAPTALHVSFKLETDEQLLLQKSKASITRYGVHCVVANELNTRTERCASTVALIHCNAVTCRRVPLSHHVCCPLSCDI